MAGAHQVMRDSRLAFVVFVCSIVAGGESGGSRQAVADSCEVAPGDRPAPGFGRVRFFNGSSTSRPTAVTGTATTKSGGSYQASPGSASPNGTSAFVDGSSRTEIVSTETHIRIGANVITVTNVAPSGWHLMESQILLIDDGATKVRAEGRCLVATTGAFKWEPGTATASIPKAGTPTAALTTKLELQDLTVLNSSPDTHVWELHYASAFNLKLGRSFVDAGQIAGTWASTGQIVSETKLYIDPPSNPLATLSTGSGESIFLSVFMLNSGTGGALTATATGVIQNSQAPYWTFR